MHRHHLLMFLPVLVTALFAGVVLGHRWRARRRTTDGRSVFGH